MALAKFGEMTYDFTHAEWDEFSTFPTSLTGRVRGGNTFLSLDEPRTESQLRFEPAECATPESLYERRWALSFEFFAFFVVNPYRF